MNGYGHFVPALFWSVTYWLSIFALFGWCPLPTRAAAPTIRCAPALRLALRRAPRLAPAAAASVSGAAGSGLWYYLQRPRLERVSDGQGPPPHPGRTTSATSRNTSSFRSPRLTAVDAPINIYPERRSFDGTGRFTLQNKTGAPISQVHSPTNTQSVSQGAIRPAFSPGEPRPARSVFHLRAGSSAALRARSLHSRFRSGTPPAASATDNELPEFAYNGTFFDSGYFPQIGYDQGFELDDPRRRREQKLGPLEEMAARGEPVHSRINLFTTHFRLDHLPHRGQHLRRPDRHRSRLSAARVAARRPALSTSTAWAAPISWISSPISPRATQTRKETLLGPERPRESGGLLRSSAHLRHRRHAGLLARRPGLLSGALQPVPVRAVPHHGVPALPQFRAVVSQHRALLRRDRFHRAHGAQGRRRPDLLRHRA